MALLHAESTAVNIMHRFRREMLVTFNSNRPVGSCVKEISEMITKITQDNYSAQNLNWSIFSDYSAEAMTKKLAEAFDLIVSNH